MQAPQKQISDQDYQASVIVANDDSFPMEAVLNAVLAVVLLAAMFNIYSINGEKEHFGSTISSF